MANHSQDHQHTLASLFLGLFFIEARKALKSYHSNRESTMNQAENYLSSTSWEVASFSVLELNVFSINHLLVLHLPAITDPCEN